MAAKQKATLHPRNLHHGRYNLKELCKASPQLSAFVKLNDYQEESVDFANPEAVKALNKALLLHFYKLNYWDIPAGYLCPPVPGRADYIHYTADVLAEANNGVVPTGSKVKILDIGVGANCVYPIIGNSAYGWSFVGTDIDPAAIQSADQIISSNTTLKDNVECRLQDNLADIFKGVVQPDELFDMVMCNPPFHASIYEANAGTIKKWRNLGMGDEQKAKLNFGGKGNELWYPGGEAAFANRMAGQSALIARSCLWFSTIVSKKENLDGLYRTLKKFGVFDIKTIGMGQGQKISRLVAWTFLNEADRLEWAAKRWGD